MNRNVISIHAPHAGRDGVNIKIIDKLILFQSTRPMRGATFRLVTGSLKLMLFQSTRPMRGATSSETVPKRNTETFQSTRPMRGATATSVRVFSFSKFQSTRPMRGATSVFVCSVTLLADFNPRAPCGARQQK